MENRIMYTNQLTKYLINKIKSIDSNYTPQTIIDAGPRELDQSIEFLNIFPNARIIAFEPHPEHYQYCKQRASSYKNIEVYNYALCDIDGERDFWMTENNGASSIFEPINDNKNPCGKTLNKVKVKTVTFNTILPQLNVKKIDILWMDIQGAELKALQGCSNYINDIDFIECEASEYAYYKNHDLKNALEIFFDNNNFTHEFHLPFEGPPHAFMEGELVCINKKLFKK